MNSIRIPHAALAPAGAVLLGQASAAAQTVREPGVLPGRVASRHGPLAACRNFLRRLADQARLRELDARIARDLGLPAGGASGAPLDAFLVDPRPLWGVGLTPMPIAAPRPSRRVPPRETRGRADAAGQAGRRHPPQAQP